MQIGAPHPTHTPRVIVVGGGVGGLAAAARLAHAGLNVALHEAAPQLGGKAAALSVNGREIDAGPTVVTMRWVFDQLFADLGDALQTHAPLERCAVLARHFWPDGSRLDLHADLQDSLTAVAAWGGARAAGQLAAFAERAAQVYRTLEGPFLRDARPGPVGLSFRVLKERGWQAPQALWGITPFQSLWQQLQGQFDDPRLQQLFGRYATYCGSSPLLAPATLMLVAHVEQEAVWQLPGGVARLVQALAGLARRQGAQLNTCSPVAEILVQGARVRGVRLANGIELPADAVVFNGDAHALSAGLLGQEVARALGARKLRAAERSLSALVALCHSPTGSAPLSHHNVFFGPAYAEEFRALGAGRLPRQPTIYVCAQDRGASARASKGQDSERLQVLVNAPARPDLRIEDMATCLQQTEAQLARWGLPLSLSPSPTCYLRGPEDFAHRYPGTAGALYGRASHGWRASFQRPAQRTRVAGLWQVGGSTHPGPGMPMAALSAQLASQQLLADLALTRRFHPVATPGGTSTR